MNKNLDSITTLQEKIKSFCDDRDWNQFHPPKDLAIGISTEANELLDLFRFKTDQEITGKLQDPTFKVKVEHELADIFFFVLRFAQMNKINLSDALSAKMEINAQKYPIEKARGSNKKYNE